MKGGKRVLVADVSMLGPTDDVVGRHFCSPALYERDLAILGYMLEDLRAFTSTVPYETVAAGEHRSLEWTVHGLTRRIVVCDARRVTMPDLDLCVVGFFGVRRKGLDDRVLDDVNELLVGEFRDYPGILSYSSTELADRNWANLVIHDEPSAREYWRASKRHAQAASVLAPIHYESVRIHNGNLPGGVRGQKSIVLERTKYWDYSDDQNWQAIRDLQPT